MLRWGLYTRQCLPLSEAQPQGRRDCAHIIERQYYFDTVELLRIGKSNVSGADSGVNYPADRQSGSAILAGTFNVVWVVVALPKARSSEARARIAEIVSEQTGVVQKAVEEAPQGRSRRPN